MISMINFSSLLVFLLVVVRITGFFVMLPLFSYSTIPNLFKIGFMFFFGLIITTTIGNIELTFDGFYLFLLMKEALVGLAIGLFAYIILSAIQIAGGFIDFQMGFAIANVIDPQTGAQSPLTGQYFYIISLLFLLSVDGHHLLIDGMYYSYQAIPVDQLVSLSNQSLIDKVIYTFSEMFLTAFQLAIPIVGCLFLVDIALGMIARTVPQLNVFVVGLPLKILVSFISILVFLALYIGIVKRLFTYMFDTLHGFMQILGGA
ncbi:MAG TPA: flagellar type III secretion system protein FliR [Candidatus Avamphibacillus intestinigallinarum]|nr:flagellar type III secretion system protein FliR [Candidatus Avamphibacillus intestinigallinarum]